MTSEERIEENVCSSRYRLTANIPSARRHNTAKWWLADCPRR